MAMVAPVEKSGSMKPAASPIESQPFPHIAPLRKLKSAVARGGAMGVNAL